MKFFDFSFGNTGEVQQKYGVINTSILKYITPTMVAVVVMCAVLIVLNYGQLYVNYTTNIPLNSVILIVFLFAMVEAFNNNLNIFNTARFLKAMEEQINSPLVSDQVVQKMKRMLDTSAYLINTQNTFRLLDNLQKYGHPLITDNDARLIKSKLGFRIRIQRGSVSFMGGLLVMLGLIGTFWGLLLTIGSVSEAMDVIAEQADSLGSSEGAGIGGIIQSISAPLQGMGLAFSSSLFGLAGSLVVGFFNYSCSQAQDKAIEDFSRWIDENIPTVGSEEEKFLKLEQGVEIDEEETKEQEVVKSTENDFQKIIQSPEFLNQDITSQILFTLQQSTLAQNDLSDNFEKLLSAQSSMHELLILQNEQGIKNYEVNTKISDGISALSEQTLKTVEVNQARKILSETLVSQNTEILDRLVKENQALDNGFDGLRGRLEKLEKAIDHSNNYFADMVSALNNEQKTQAKLVSEVVQIKGKIPQSEYENLRIACNHISASIGAMEKALNDNVEIMKEVSKEGNLDRMARILKEMQVFWLQMKQNAFDVVKKGSLKK